MEKTLGLLIRRIPLTETSYIVTWCTPEYGLIKTVAKGARRTKSPFAGKLDLCFSAELEFTESPRSELHTLREVRVLVWRSAIQSSYLRLLAAAYFVQLIELMVEPSTPIPEFYDLLERGFGWLEKQEPDLRGVLHFENEIVKLVGIQTHQSGSAIQAIRATTQREPPNRSQLLAALHQASSVPPPSP